MVSAEMAKNHHELIPDLLSLVRCEYVATLLRTLLSLGASGMNCYNSYI